MLTKEKMKDFFEDKNRSKIIGREASMNSAVLVLFCEIEGKIYVLFEKRAMGIRQGGEVSFPGGRREKSDLSFMETALRETSEEIGLSKDRITDVRKYGTLIIPTGVIVEAYIGYVKDLSMEELEWNRDEVERVFFVPLDFFFETEPEMEYVTVQNQPFYIDEKGEKVPFPAQKWGLPEKYSHSWTGHPRRILFYLYGGDVIWGITAEIIYSISRELRNRIKK